MKLCSGFAIVALILLTLLAGCGSDEGGTVSVQAASQKCIGCHGGNSAGISKITGMRITDEWQRSAHNYGQAAGCSSCHGAAHNHPSSCGQCHGGATTVTPRFKNPDSSRHCDTCHAPGAGSRPLDVTAAQHYFKNSSRASYMFTNYPEVTGSTSLCARCHNPHDPSTFLHINRSYAQSGHGDVAGLGWAEEDFKRASCNPYCHTTTSYLKFIRNEATPQTFAPVAFDPADSTKEVLACIACHQDYSWKLRAAGPQKSAFKSQGDGNVEVIFPDVKASNLCIVCHAGRTAGGNVETLGDNSFTNQGFKHTHYMAAAGVMYGKVGFEFYTSHAAYVAGKFRHDQIGTSAYPATGDRGPCVSCHMYPGNHSLKAFNKEASFVSPVCGGCHSTARTSPEEFIEEMETEKTRYDAALEELKNLLKTRGYHFYPKSPYFYIGEYDSTYTETGTCSENLPVRNWMTTGTFTYAWNGTNCTSTGTVGTTGTATATNANIRIGLTDSPTGKFNSYAASNWKALYSEPGGWAHRRKYVKRLIYDSIDWLDDNQFNYSVGKTLSTLRTENADNPERSENLDKVITYLIPVATRGGTDYINLTGTGDASQRP